MQLKIQRSQKTSGLMSKSVVFCLDARLHLSDEESENMKKYKLDNTLVYDSENAKKHAAGVMDATSTRSLGGAVRGIAHIAMHKLSLSITLKKLVDGTHIECKDMPELLGAEEAIKQACETANAFLIAAATFDGSEEVFDVV